MRYVCRPTKGGVLGTVWEDWIVVKCCFHSLCLWIFPLETTLFPFPQEGCSADDVHPSEPRGHRVLRPRPVTDCPAAASLPRSASRSPDNDSGNCDKVSSPFLLRSLPSPLSSSLSLSFSTLKIYYSCELWRRCCCSRKSTVLVGERPIEGRTL